MKKLVLYSDFAPPRSENVDARVLPLLEGTDFSVGYIPSDSDKTRRYFNRVVENYATLGISDVSYFDLKDEFDASKLDTLLKCAAIHLSGGDLSIFLQSVQRRQFKKILSDYVDKGGVLIGVSAGAMLMARDIEIGELFPESELRLKERRALGLVDFDFFPHFDGREKTLRTLCDYSKKTKRAIYACDDSEGVVVLDDKIELIGAVTIIKEGKIYEA